MDLVWCTRLSHWKDGEPLEEGLVCYENPRTTILGISTIALPLSGDVEAMGFKIWLWGNMALETGFTKFWRQLIFLKFLSQNVIRKMFRNKQPF